MICRSASTLSEVLVPEQNQISLAVVSAATTLANAVISSVPLAATIPTDTFSLVRAFRVIICRVRSYKFPLQRSHLTQLQSCISTNWAGSLRFYTSNRKDPGNLPVRPIECGMNARNQHSQRIGKDLSKSAIAGLLCVTAILYFAIQWKYASRIGPNRIFSASRMTDQVDFAVMIDGLSKAAHRACNSGSLNTLLFDDSESALPYIETQGDRLGGCMVIRETNVTPFSKAEMEGCNVVYIREYGPSYADQNSEAALRTYNTLPRIV